MVVEGVVKGEDGDKESSCSPTAQQNCECVGDSSGLSSATLEAGRMSGQNKVQIAASL
jgi:hypothetical protein